MKKITTILLVLAHCMCFGQSKKTSFNRVMERYLFKSTSDRLYDTPKNHAYIYAIGVSFNNKGLIDTLYFSDGIDASIKDIFMLDDRKIRLFKSISIPFEEYANKIVLLTLYHYNSQDGLADYQSNILVQLEKLYPKIDSTKPIILHQPMVYGFVRHIN